ncbi:hypothetical protein BH747_02075 [Enterococcus villorum]|uniref:Uncharacterized protein n=1 Tax=Enterococcus villorum TaxID=112904 RepID=A0A1V8YU85_9ENTE|nr:hypothetical protein [Enterococcus villorum]OQO71640.1 hypothetical protein BH747_02075 [Enterococcus villorum]OQO76203.1 hypothetical protein BH744_04480 [Enterococcus villorum]
MRDVRERIDLMADEIFDLEMSKREDKFWTDLGKKGLTSKHIDLPTVFEIHYAIFYKQLEEYWKNRISIYRNDMQLEYGTMNLREYRSYLERKFHQILDSRYEELLREVWEEYEWVLNIKEEK